MILASLLGAGIGMLTGAGPVGQGIGAAIGALVSGDDPKKTNIKRSDLWRCRRIASWYNGW